jgi:hypothetical protein
MQRILHDLIEGTRLFADQAPQEATLETMRMAARVNATIVKAALAENDFATAYETCMTKLVPVTGPDTDEKIAEIAWSAFFNTGNFTGQPATRGPSRITTSTLNNEKMELLARALMICPKEEMDGIVTRWTALEAKLFQPETAREQKEPVVNAPVKGSVEHHRGFFETAAQVGRSVAQTASPIIGGGNGFERRKSSEMEQDEGRVAGEFGGTWGSSGSRFGVRDTVKSGLTQGIGWLLGATAVSQDTSDEHT